MKKYILLVFILVTLLFTGCNEKKYFFEVDSIAGFTIKLSSDNTIELYKDKYDGLPLIIKQDDIDNIGYKYDVADITSENRFSGTENTIGKASVLLITLKDGNSYQLILKPTDKNIIDIFKNQKFNVTDAIFPK